MVSLKQVFEATTKRTRLESYTLEEQIEILRAQRVILTNRKLREDAASDISTLNMQRQQLVLKKNQQNEQIDRQIRALDQMIMQKQQLQQNQQGQPVQPTQPTQQQTQNTDQQAMQAQQQTNGPGTGSAKALM
jgi:hypothetical protein